MKIPEKGRSKRKNEREALVVNSSGGNSHLTFKIWRAAILKAENSVQCCRKILTHRWTG